MVLGKHLPRKYVVAGHLLPRRAEVSVEQKAIAIMFGMGNIACMKFCSMLGAVLWQVRRNGNIKKRVAWNIK